MGIKLNLNYNNSNNYFEIKFNGKQLFKSV